jgi:hypothetical protein
MSAVEALPFVSTPFVAVPRVSASVGASTLVWSDGGSPAVLDPASSAILDAYSGAMTPKELADELMEIAGLSPEIARKAAYETTWSLNGSNLLARSGEDPRPAWTRFYPPQGTT